MNRNRQIHIQPERLLKDLKELATFGKLKTGVSRTSFSEADTKARQWLEERMHDAGLETAVDKVGNVHGKTNKAPKSVIIGSHTDSVPVGGWLDGSLGVIYGLEIARSVIEHGLDHEIGVHVTSFMDEEGTYLACLGSKTFCGDLTAEEFSRGKNATGETLLEAITRSGFSNNSSITLNKDEHIAYLEAHIEQGPRLESSNKTIGIVTGIVGIRRLLIEIVGEADHAGTVPMAMRKDAGAAAINFSSLFLNKVKKVCGPDSVWNIGSMTFKPGAANVVPARAEIMFEIRDLEPDRLTAMEEILQEISQEKSKSENLKYNLIKKIDISPSAMSSQLSKHILNSAENNDVPYMIMPSGAGHDAMIFARHIESAMLFIPSINGKSHSEAEDTLENDIIAGCNVLAGCVENIFSNL